MDADTVKHSNKKSKPDVVADVDVNADDFSVGIYLASVRQAKSLTLDSIAKELKIPEEHLWAIESDRQLSLVNTFAKAYVKKYAAYLALDADMVQKRYEQTVLRENQLEAENVTQCSSLMSEEERPCVQLRSGSSWSNSVVKWPGEMFTIFTSAALPMVCLGMLTFAYFTMDQGYSSSSIVTENDDIVVVETERNGKLASELITATETTSQQSATSQKALVQQLASLEANNTSTELNRTLAQSNMNDIPSALDDNIPAESGDSENAYSAEYQSSTEGSTLKRIKLASKSDLQYSNNVPNENISDSFEPVGPGAVDMISQVTMQDRLEITVYEDSWLDIRDATGKRLYRNLAQAGKKIDLSGSLPFSLHLGNVPGLEIELNGVPVEITRYRSDNSARLTLASN